MSETDLNALARRFSQALDASGMSARELASKVGAHPSYIARILKGERHPSPEWIQKIAETLGIDPNELLEYIGIKPSSVLPDLQTYFTRKMGIPEEEANMLANVVQYLHKQKEDLSEETEQERHDSPD
jgi:transcriptional regulator with XRE-family HTH domain